MPGGSEWSGRPSIRGSTESIRMIFLTSSLLGLTLTWGLEQTYCTPYLLSLGLTKSRVSLVWIAGPLSGLIGQPVIGAIADRSTSKYGRRRPFMIGGSIVSAACLIVLGWTKEIVGAILNEGPLKKNIVIVLAVLSIYALDFAINVVQACCRSIIVDVLPISQQQIGSAWASRMGAMGSIVGFWIGTLDLVKVLPGWLGGDTQFQKMVFVAILGLFCGVGVTCYTVTERVLIYSPDHGTSTFSTLTTLWNRIWKLPPRIQLICWCQFWVWIGWFPFLFYSSTWVGETYYRYEHPAPADGGQDNHDALGNVGRLGSLALVLFSIVTFATSVGMPYFVWKPDNKIRRDQRGPFTPRPPPSLGENIQRFITLVYNIPKPDLVTAWALSHLAFAGIMIWAPFVRSLAAATILVTLCGVPWAVTGWAPFAEMGIEINKLASGGLATTTGADEIVFTADGYTAVRASMDNDDDIEVTPQVHHRRASSLQSTGVLHLSHPEGDEGESSATGELAGVYLGVLNVYTTLPQFVSTFISWIVFSLFEPGKNVNDSDENTPEHHKYLNLKGVNSIAVCLFIGAISALIAAEATRRLKKMS